LAHFGSKLLLLLLMASQTPNMSGVLAGGAAARATGRNKAMPVIVAMSEDLSARPAAAAARIEVVIGFPCPVGPGREDTGSVM
jgi:hypothetical protein